MSRSSSVEDYVTKMTAGKGFDIVFDTVGGATIDSSFVAVKRYTGHVVSCLGWATHSLARLSMRVPDTLRCVHAAPSNHRGRPCTHGEILAHIATVVEVGKLKPLLNDHIISVAEANTAHALVESGALGKVVVELGS